MHFLASIFVPTGNRRLNELVGFLLCVSALLLFLALASYSPLDPSLNSASVLTGAHAARNWIGVVGALVSDLALQFFGIGAFLLPIFPFMLGHPLVRVPQDSISLRQNPGRNLAGDVCSRASGVVAGQYALAARDPHRRPARPSSGRCAYPLLEPGWRLYRLRQRAGGGALSFDGVLVLVYPTLGSDTVRVRDCAVESLLDWQEERAKKRQQKELDKRRISKPQVKTQLIPSRQAVAAEPTVQARVAPEPRRTGIERTLDPEPTEAATNPLADRQPEFCLSPPSHLELP